MNYNKLTGVAGTRMIGWSLLIPPNMTSGRILSAWEEMGVVLRVASSAWETSRLSGVTGRGLSWQDKSDIGSVGWKEQGDTTDWATRLAITELFCVGICGEKSRELQFVISCVGVYNPCPQIVSFSCVYRWCDFCKVREVKLRLGLSKRGCGWGPMAFPTELALVQVRSMDCRDGGVGNSQISSFSVDGTTALHSLVLHPNRTLSTISTSSDFLETSSSDKLPLDSGKTKLASIRLCSIHDTSESWLPISSNQLRKQHTDNKTLTSFVTAVEWARFRSRASISFDETPMGDMSSLAELSIFCSCLVHLPFLMLALCFSMFLPAFG